VSGDTGIMGGVLGIRKSVPCLAGSSRRNAGASEAGVGLLAGHTHNLVDGLACELCLPLGHEQPEQVVLADGEVALDGAELVASIGCSTERLPLRRATHNLNRLTSSWLRRIWMASLTHRPWR
jgi:hypothetical protein